MRMINIALSTTDSNRPVRRQVHSTTCRQLPDWLTSEEGGAAQPRRERSHLTVGCRSQDGSFEPTPMRGQVARHVCSEIKPSAEGSRVVSYSRPWRASDTLEDDDATCA